MIMFNFDTNSYRQILYYIGLGNLFGNLHIIVLRSKYEKINK